MGGFMNQFDLSSHESVAMDGGMTFKRKLSVSIATFVASGLLGFAQESVPVAPSAPQTTDTELTDEEMLQIYGWMAGMRAGISRLGLSATELEAFQAGVAAAGTGVDLDQDLQRVGPAISRFVQSKFDSHMARMKAAQEAVAAEFWAELLASGEVQQLPSGLAYTIVRPGEGPKPVAADTIRAHYTGSLIDGTVFDTSKGGGPFETKLDQVIEGWTQGLPLIGEGGAIKLYIPADLGYGDTGTPSIPPGATLIFEVELVTVIPSVAKPTSDSSEDSL